MAAFIWENSGTIVTGAVVFGIAAAIAVKMIRDAKNGRGGCSCSCGNCEKAAGSSGCRERAPQD